MLRSVAAGNIKIRDDFDIFGDHVASILRKLSEVLTEQDYLVKFNATSALIANDKLKSSLYHESSDT